VKKILTILVILFASSSTEAQFARVSLDRRSVYVQQPFKVTITVLTPTWYTAPLDFDNIQVPGAFILPFDRTEPGMFDIDGKKYAGLQFYYIVFPYKAGSFNIPSLNIVATTPPEGSSTSRKITLKTAPQHFTVKNIPNLKGAQTWFVAKNVSVHERWSKPLSNLKVGDIIERTITVEARGTLPQFIPQLQKDSLAFASTYLQDAELKDERDDYDANGRLTQSVIYLLEKEGDFTIPSVEVQWWNPNSSKLYSKHAFAGKIHVKPNPNLGMLSTLKDSLAAKQAALKTVSTVKTPRTIFGIAWYWAVLIAVVGLLLLYRIVRVSIRWGRSLHKSYQRYIASEAHAFSRFMRSPLELTPLLQNLYQWWDRFPITEKSASISRQLLSEKQTTTAAAMQEYLDTFYEAEKTDSKANSDFKKAIRDYRKDVLSGKHDSAANKISIQQTAWVLT
jgi:hypothetical protein